MSTDSQNTAFSLLENDTLFHITLEAGPFDASCLRSFKEGVESAWADSIQRVEIDFSEATFIDSPMVGALLSLYKKCQSEDALLVVNPNPVVRKTLELFHMESVFEVTSMSSL